MHSITLKKMLFPLVIALFLFSFSACRSTGGSVGYEWGHGTDNGHYHDTERGRKKGPPPHAPAHGYRAKYKYRYYPDCSVYYDDYRKLYFYLEGPNWRVSASLPHAFRASLGHHVYIEMDTDKPYSHYKEHKHKYPPGQLKKKAKNKNKWSKLFP